jgi:hypothetical protein
MTHQRRNGSPAPAGANDQDKHGRKQNSGTNQKTLRGKGSRRDHGSDGADTPPREPGRQP